MLRFDQFSPRSHFAAHQAKKLKSKGSKSPKTASVEPDSQIQGSGAEQAQPDQAKSVEPDNTGEGDVNAHIASLNERIAQLNVKLEATKSRDNNIAKLEAEFQESKTEAKEAKRASEELTATQERFKAFKDKVEEKEHLQNQRYSKVGFQLQLFAEWSLSPNQRKRYHEELDKVNKKRRAEGKLPK